MCIFFPRLCVFLWISNDSYHPVGFRMALTDIYEGRGDMSLSVRRTLPYV